MDILKQTYVYPVGLNKLIHKKYYGTFSHQDGHQGSPLPVIIMLLYSPFECGTEQLDSNTEKMAKTIGYHIQN